MVRNTLQQIVALLEKNHAPDARMTRALSGDEAAFWDYLVSNELWGGAGSIADQALLDRPDTRSELDGLMVQLGREQMKLGKVNVRTSMWVDAFEKWRAEGLR